MGIFNHLHVHSMYSLLDSLCKIKPLVDKAKEQGSKAIAITDHGNMFGVIDFYKYAKSVGIKPIIGCEVYVATRSRFDKSAADRYSHLILLAKNNVGYHNLMKLVSLSYVEGYYYKPRIDIELLKKYSEGLICLTACLYGSFSKALCENDLGGAKNVLKEFCGIFDKEHLYVEIQDHGLLEQRRILKNQIELAREFDLGIVATNDVHYIEKEDAFYQEVLICIQTQKTILDEDRMKFDSQEMYLKSYEEMSDLFSYCTEAITNTEKIADMCDVQMDFSHYHLPKFQLKDGENSFSYLKELSMNGLLLRYGEDASNHIERLNYELETIEKMGFTDYFLICNDFVMYAKRNKIAVGPGRGSAAGSIVSYVLNITDIDPIKYGLVFERFLNAERVTMPDIDIDFCYERRGEVIDYVIRKYGSEKVSQIVTFGTLGAKQAIRDVGRVLNMTYQDVDLISKLIPFGIHNSLENTLKNNPDFIKLYNTRQDIKRLYDIAVKIEGLPRHTSTHAAGVVVANKPIMEYVPLAKNDDVLITQYTMTTLEELGLLKMDFLGLRNLTVIQDAIKNICESKNIELDVHKMDYDDKVVFSLFKTGDTDGIFQFESFGMRRFIREFKPDSLEDLIICVSVYRPGPMDQIPKLLKNKENPQLVTYYCEELREILEPTYGCIVYQEQVMEIFKRLAGYSLGKADIVRRAMSKKKMDVLKKEEELFIEGCKKNNISMDISKKIFSEIQEFAKYAFNKSHAAAYSVIAYQTAYLKYYYKSEFMAALMTSFIDSQNKVVLYIKSCKQQGIKVNPPSINESLEKFYAKDNNIIFGLSAVKNVGYTMVKSIVEERLRNGLFADFNDFVLRMIDKDLNKRAIESLIKVGAFDDFNDRLDLLKNFETIIDSGINNFKTNVPGQISLFEEPDVINEAPVKNMAGKRKKELSLIELNMEKEILGFYLSSHPLAEYEDTIKKISTAYSYEIVGNNEEQDTKFKDGDLVTLVGIISDKKSRATKKNAQMALFNIEDLFGLVNVIAFPMQFEKYANLIFDDNIVVLKGTVSYREDEPVKLILNDLKHFNKDVNYNKVYLKITKENEEKMDYLKSILKFHNGETPVYVYFEEKKQNTLAGKEMWVSVNKILVNKLKEILGEENIRIV